MSDSHAVKLPYPDRVEPTVGSCDSCDWTTVYGWGQHDAAVAAASEHVRDAAGADPVETSEMNGDRFIIPGRSL